MVDKKVLSRLFRSAGPPAGRFDGLSLEGAPEAYRRYILHSIEPGSPLATAVRLEMRGKIRLGEGWLPFRARQVILSRGEMIWSATVRRMGLPITGYDRLVGGQGEMNWRLLGVIPVMKASGRDITLSAMGRLWAEMQWLPSSYILLDARAGQISDRCFSITAGFEGEERHAEVTTDENGALKAVRMKRWGNPLDKDFDFYDFGGVAEEERSFGGYTIPTVLRAGWHFRDGDFQEDGEFFRATILDACFNTECS